MADTYKATVDLKALPAGGSVDVWTVIAANDELGCTIDNVRPGDVLEIVDASGTASFAKKGNSVFMSFIAVVEGAMEDVMTVFGADNAKRHFHEQLDIWRSRGMQLEDSAEKFRNANGRITQGPDNGYWARNEGGLIICMPEAGGAIYSSPDNRLRKGTRDHGRKSEYYKDGAFIHRNPDQFKYWFLAHDVGGVDGATVTQEGVIHILAYDISKRRDNSGFYVLKLRVTRPEQ